METKLDLLLKTTYKPKSLNHFVRNYGNRDSLAGNNRHARFSASIPGSSMFNPDTPKEVPGMVSIYSQLVQI